MTDFSSTSLDHILTNENRYPLTPIVIDYDLTDHCPIMVKVSNKLKPNRDDNKSIFKRFFTEFSVDNFNQELHDRLDDFLIRNASIDENNFDKLFNNFHSIVTQTIDKHAPLKN